MVPPFSESWVKESQINDLQISDVTPLSLGIETLGGFMSVVIPRNTQIPCEQVQLYKQPYDGDLKISIVVYQGEASMVTLNHRLGEFILDGMKPRSSEDEQNIEVTFHIDVNGILNVKARDRRDSSVVNTIIRHLN